MSIAIRYFSRGGNTKKLAEAIASAVGVEAATVNQPLSEKVDILFLGSSVYAAGVDESIKRFLADNKENIGTIVNFSTAALIPSTYNQVKKLASEHGIAISEQEFHCRGSFSLLHRGHPNAEDCKNVEAFAKKVVEDDR